MLTTYLSQLQWNDSSNREGHAAKVYFNALFGPEFTRSGISPINSALDYGYSLILSTINREISAAGYLNQLGICHQNIFNPFNLACDFIEPLRPLVDHTVKSLQPEKLEREEKIVLLSLLNRDVSFDGKKQSLLYAIRLYCTSLFRALESGDPAEIKWIDYVSLSLDDRKLQNRFQSLLQGAIREELAEQTNHLQQEIHSYLQKVTLHLDYPVCCTQGDYVQPLLKSIRYQPVLDGLEPLGRLAQYIELYSRLMKHQCFVLVGAHSYFSPGELKELYRTAFYQKWKLLLLEPGVTDLLPEEDVVLLDKDFCELHLDSSQQLL